MIWNFLSVCGLILATATHSVGAYDTSVGKLKPYVDAGLNYTIFYGADSGPDEA